jgi:sugar lactone lactonase YvrE
MEVINLHKSQCILGESPYWHAERKSFFWVDIEKGELYEFQVGLKKTTKRKFNQRLSLVLEGQGEYLILALDRKIARYDLETEKLTWLIEVEDDQPLNRFNDGACDADGRLWIGTMSTKFTPGSGSLYKITSELSPEKMLGKISISNGMAWTADNETFYYIDSPTQEIRAYHFDLETGEIIMDRTVIRVPKELGTPDGMSIDQQGKLWVAHYGGFGVYCWDPENGKLLKKISLPVPNVTSCVFGGENLDHLLITTARENLTEAQLKEFPESGDVFLVKTNTQGFLPNSCEF